MNETTALLSVTKRDGRVVPFQRQKIAVAIGKAAETVGHYESHVVAELTDAVLFYLQQSYPQLAPTIENIQDAVEKILTETGYAAVAQAYALYRDYRRHIRQTLKVYGPGFAEERAWDKHRIRQDLKQGRGLADSVAEEVAGAMERKISSTGYSRVSTNLIAEMVEHELIHRGYAVQRGAEQSKSQAVVMFSQLEDLVSAADKAYTPFSTARLNAAVSRVVWQQYMEHKVFPASVMQAHQRGEIHVEHMDHRFFYSGIVALEGLKTKGLARERAAKYAHTLMGQLAQMLKDMRGYFASHIAVPYSNILLAPYMEGMSYKQMKQELQSLFYNCCGSFAVFHVYPVVPVFFQQIPAVGAEGQPTGKCYAAYADVAEMVAMAMLDTWQEECTRLRKSIPTDWPLLHVHISEDALKTTASQEMVKTAALWATHNDAIFLYADRTGEALCTQWPDVLSAHTLLAGGVLQSVLINVPQSFLRVREHQSDSLYLLLSHYSDVAVQALRHKFLFHVPHTDIMPQVQGQVVLCGLGTYTQARPESMSDKEWGEAMDRVVQHIQLRLHKHAPEMPFSVQLQTHHVLDSLGAIEGLAANDRVLFGSSLPGVQKAYADWRICGQGALASAQGWSTCVPLNAVGIDAENLCAVLASLWGLAQEDLWC